MCWYLYLSSLASKHIIFELMHSVWRLREELHTDVDPYSFLNSAWDQGKLSEVYSQEFTIKT